MLFRKIICIVLLSLVLLNLAWAAEPRTDPNAELVKQTITAFMEKNSVPGVAIELYVDGKPYEYYFGYANRETKMPVTKNTIFEIGSITKLMTSLLLAQQVDAAKVQLDNSVTDYLTDLPEVFDDITLGNLATHTAGLPFQLPNSIKSKSELQQYYLRWHPEYVPDEEWVYSNIGMGLLGESLEKITQKPLEQLYVKRILIPLGMSPFAFTIPVRYKKFIAQGYDQEGSPVASSQPGLYPAGYAIRVSSLDMQRFLAATIGLSGTPERLLYPIRMTQSAYVQLPAEKQGLGWNIRSLEADNISSLLNNYQFLLGPLKVEKLYERPLYDGNTLIDKAGKINGFRSYIAVIPKKQSGIVILVNRDLHNEDTVKAAREILFKVTGIVPKEPSV